MEELNRFKKYLVESKDSVSSLKINEQDMPEFTETDKEILDWMADNIEGGILEPTDYPDDIFNEITNKEGYEMFNSYSDAERFLDKVGFKKALKELLEFEETIGYEMSNSIVLNALKDDDMRVLGNFYAGVKGEHLLLASEIIAQAIAAQEPFTEEDIEDLEKEIRFLSDN